MKRQPSNRSALLLMEIIIAILFFSIVSAICLQLFVKSHNLSRSTEILDDAVAQTSSVAEMIRATGESPASIMYYDKDFDACDKEKAQFAISVTPSDAKDGFFEIDSYDISTKRSIYSLEVHTYAQRKYLLPSS